jgi:hypothetical protein
MLNQTSPVYAVLPSLILSYLCLDIRSGRFPLDFLTNILYAPLFSPMFITCDIQLNNFIFISTIISGEMCKPLTSSLYSFTF